MKKSYNYLLFRIYMFYRDRMKEKDNLSLYASFVTTLLISINVMTIYFLFEYLELLPFIPNKYYIIVFMILIWCVNYYGIVKNENFLTYNFKKDKKGGYAIVFLMILTLLSAVSVGNLNRQKVFKESQKIQSNDSKKESLEGKVRKWFNE